MTRKNTTTKLLKKALHEILLLDPVPMFRIRNLFETSKVPKACNSKGS